MRLVSTKEFHDHVTRFLRSGETLAVTTHGEVTGFYIPHRGTGLPADVRWQIVSQAASKVRKDLVSQGVTEKEVLKDFERWRKNNKRPGRRR